MSNYESVVRMLNSANITFTKRRLSGGGCIITVGAGAGPANEGVGGLYTTFEFNADNELAGMGAWEGAGAAVA